MALFVGQGHPADVDAIAILLRSDIGVDHVGDRFAIASHRGTGLAVPVALMGTRTKPMDPVECPVERCLHPQPR